MSETTDQVDPLDRRPGDAALARLDRYDWLVATSARGVSALMRRLAAGQTAGVPSELRVAAVGPATAAALREAGVHVDLVAEEASSEGLVAALAAVLSARARVVVVRPEGPSGPLVSALAAAGYLVDEAPLYRTVASAAAPVLADAAIEGAFAAVVFTAPSSLDLWLDAAGDKRESLIAALRRVVRVAIGPTTASRMTALSLPADATAETPSEPAVAVAVASALGIDLLR
jgi:uroporphyrinogen-III synthase